MDIRPLNPPQGDLKNNRQTRPGNFPFSKRQHNATFTIDLCLSEEDIWKGVDTKQRNTIRKGEKNGVTVLALNADNSIAYLDAFQKLRKQKMTLADIRRFIRKSGS